MKKPRSARPFPPKKIKDMNETEIWQYIMAQVPDEAAQEWLCALWKDARQELRDTKVSLAAEENRVKVMADRLSQQEKIIERLWTHKVIALLHVLQMKAAFYMHAGAHGELGAIADSALKDLPKTLYPDWKGDRAE